MSTPNHTLGYIIKLINTLGGLGLKQRDMEIQVVGEVEEVSRLVEVVIRRKTVTITTTSQLEHAAL